MRKKSRGKNMRRKEEESARSHLISKGRCFGVHCLVFRIGETAGHQGAMDGKLPFVHK